MLPSENNTEMKTSDADQIGKRKQRICPVTPRVGDLRDQSQKKNPSLSGERAKIITEFYKNVDLRKDSVPVQRAKAFHYIMNHVSIPVESGQLIVGIRGPDIKEVPTYPEICCHSLDDLYLLSQREKNSYHVTDELRQLYHEDIIPFWQNKNIRNSIFGKMDIPWKKAYHAGIFTEFMEQRNPGHTAGGNRIFSMGLLDVNEHIEKKLVELQHCSEDTSPMVEELEAMKIASDAMLCYADRYVTTLQSLFDSETDEQRKKELAEMIHISKWVPAHAPRTFWEALQHYWYIHVGIVYEANPWDSFSPGRLDQHLYPFYSKEIKAGTLTRETAKELLELFWIKFNNHPAPSKVGVTAAESNTYNDFSKINLGGLDEHGEDGVNELSYLILEVLDEIRLLQPNTAAQISTKTSDRFLDRCFDVIDPGFGEPPLFNADVVIKQMIRQGKSYDDAVESGCSGCVESGAFGKESYIITGYFNLPKILEITLHNGVDPLSGEMIGIQTGEVSSFSSFAALKDAFYRQAKFFIDMKIHGNDVIEKLYATEQPVPFLSLWIDDCVSDACDYNCGGARYNTQYIQFVGLGTLCDSLASLQYHVFDQDHYSLEEMVSILQDDFRSCEDVRQMLINKTPKFGNDDDYVDAHAQEIITACSSYVESFDSTPVRHGSRRVYFFPTTCHVYFGEICGATPDGRKAGLPLSEGISPVQGADRNGIIPVLKSIGKLDHIATGGTLLNQRLSPDLLSDTYIKTKMRQLIRAFFSMDTHHIQFNVVSTSLLKKAQMHPEDFQDLMVRVAGYSDYFVNLPEGLQNEIIARTEQNSAES